MSYSFLNSPEIIKKKRPARWILSIYFSMVCFCQGRRSSRAVCLMTLQNYLYFRRMKIRWRIAQFFEALWWRRYLRNRPVATYLSWKRDYWKRFLIRENITVAHSDKVLDAGCGPAGLFMMFPENEVVAIDPLLDFYQERIPHFDRQSFPATTFRKLRLEELQEQVAFDKIFCLNAINHVDNLEKSMASLSAALKVNGMLYLSIDAHNNLLAKHLFSLVPGDILHPHQLSLPEYIDLVERQGLKIVGNSLLKKGAIFNYYLIKAVKE